jgi:DNA-directed RNA polymerase omega subunit
MGRVTIEKCLHKVGGSHFDLVLIATERAKQISNGKKSEILKKGIKTHVTALREIEEDKLNLQDIRTKLVLDLNNVRSKDEDDEPKESFEMVEEVQTVDFIHGDLEIIDQDNELIGHSEEEYDDEGDDELELEDDLDEEELFGEEEDIEDTK